LPKPNATSAEAAPIKETNMKNYEAFEKRLAEKGAKMIWSVEYGSLFSNSIHSSLYLTREEAEACFAKLPELGYKKVYPVEDIWNFTRKQELINALEQAETDSDELKVVGIKYTLCKEFGVCDRWAV
jgi:hypothetical protein